MSVLLSNMSVLLNNMFVLLSNMSVLFNNMSVVLNKMSVLLNNMFVLLSNMSVLLNNMSVLFHLCVCSSGPPYTSAAIQNPIPKKYEKNITVCAMILYRSTFRNAITNLLDEKLILLLLIQS